MRLGLSFVDHIRNTTLGASGKAGWNKYNLLKSIDFGFRPWQTCLIAPNTKKLEDRSVEYCKERKTFLIKSNNRLVRFVKKLLFKKWEEKYFTGANDAKTHEKRSNDHS